MGHIGVVGGGAWGTALACLARRAGRRVTLWSRDPAVASAIACERANPVYLPGMPLDGGIAADPSLGGELEFMDPRGPGPAMYAPHLAFALPGGLSVGANEVVHPKTGRLVMFPAWLLHQVRPYRGGAERISIAFNLSL